MGADATGQLANELRVPGYEVVERIGVGGFGEVYRARHERIGRDVAIKVLHARFSSDQEAVARFVGEARAVGKLSHANIVEIFDFGELPDGRQYCVMELIRGTTLREVLRQRERLPPAEALPILRGIADAVDAAHAAGIAHRDLKPDNVFVVGTDEVKLIDFGLAKLTSEEAAPVTQTGAVFGTPQYMSPEQCRGKPVTLATDAYSFGVLAYQVLVGAPPFAGEALDVAPQHLNDTPELPSRRNPALDARVDRVVLALLEKDPADRPMPLRSAIAALEGEGTLPRRARRPRGARRAWLWLAGTACVVGGGGAAALALRSSAPEPTCVLADSRMAGIWDLATRTAIEKRFAHDSRPDVATTWRRLAEDLDRYVTTWSTQWDARCGSQEPQTDPLLHAQRTACLENALQQLESVTTSLLTVDVEQFSLGFTANYLPAATADLDDCVQVSVLREQRPPPPVDLQTRVAALKRRFYAARIKVREAMSSGEQHRAVELLDEYRRVSEALEALGVTGAREMTELASLMSHIGVGHIRYAPRVRPLVDEAISRAEKSRDSALIARAHLLEAAYAFGVNAERSVMAAALQKSDEAHVRSGRPIATNYEVRTMRGWLALRDGDLARSASTFRDAVVEQERELHGAASLQRPFLVWALLSAGSNQEAIAAAQELVARETRVLGVHSRVAQAHDLLSTTYWRTGDVANALAEATRGLEVYRKIGNVRAATLQNVDLWRLDLALQRGDQRVIDESVARISERAPANKPVAEMWFDIARDTMHEFQIVCCRRTTALADFAAERARAATTDSVLLARIDDLRAYRAFGKGDWVAMESAARAAGAKLAPDPNAPIRAAWLLAVADARAGRTSDAEARLRELARYRDAGNIARMFDAWVLLALRRVHEARTVLEEARSKSTDRRGRDFTELTAWLAVARLEDGDPAGAVTVANDSLSHWVVIDYFTPMAHFALARGLWESGGDRERAQRAAVLARDGFARLGPARAADRDAVVRWLADHVPVPGHDAGRPGATP